MATQQVVALPALQLLFRDKDSGLPLSGGTLTFYKSQDGVTKKNIYKRTGTPGNYTYAALPNPSTLGMAGTFIDAEGNQCIPYLWPYDGSPDSSEGNVELYDIAIANEDGTSQYVVENWPDVSSSSTSASELKNYIPNSQFFSHTDVPPIAANGYIAGKITDAVTYIAQGGWSFVRDEGATSTDMVTFYEFVDFTSNPPGNPKFACNIECTLPVSGQSYKDLRIQFNDVNKFASLAASPIYYTFAIWSQDINGDGIDANLRLIRNYGEGGSLTTDDPIASNLPITAGYAAGVQGSFTYDNTGKNIFPGSYVQIAVRLPSDALFNVQFTSAIITDGQETIADFPIETNAKMLSEGVAGWMDTPSADGSTLYLPLIQTKQGLAFSTSDIGKIYSAGYLTPKENELLCDGTSYRVADYSSLSIPYSRLYNAIYDSTIFMARWGTGYDFVTAYGVNDPYGTTATAIRLTTNKPGAAIAAANGATSPGFTYNLIHTGDAGYGIKTYAYSANTCLVIGNLVGVVTTETAGNSGFTLTNIHHSAAQRNMFTIETIAASAMTAGHYFTFSNTITSYYVWFTINGAGADPAVPGHTGIKIDLLSTYSANDVMGCVMSSIAGHQVSEIVIGAASTIAQSSYFTFGVNPTQQYYVWYNIDGAGVDPKVTGSIGIEVNIAAADTAAIVTTSTFKAINQAYVGTPDFRGLFLRGWDPNSPQWDYDTNTRFSGIFGATGNTLATLQLYATNEHAHDAGSGEFIVNTGGSNGGAGDTWTADPVTANYGGYESRPINAYANYVIKY